MVEWHTPQAEKLGPTRSAGSSPVVCIKRHLPRLQPHPAAGLVAIAAAQGKVSAGARAILVEAAPEAADLALQADAAAVGAGEDGAALLDDQHLGVAAQEGIAGLELDGVVRLAAACPAIRAVERRLRAVAGGPVQPDRL